MTPPKKKVVGLRALELRVSNAKKKVEEAKKYVEKVKLRRGVLFLSSEFQKNCGPLAVNSAPGGLPALNQVGHDNFLCLMQLETQKIEDMPTFGGFLTAS